MIRTGTFLRRDRVARGIAVIAAALMAFYWIIGGSSVEPPAHHSWLQPLWEHNGPARVAYYVLHYLCLPVSLLVSPVVDMLNISADVYHIVMAIIATPIQGVLFFQITKIIGRLVRDGAGHGDREVVHQENDPPGGGSR